MQKSTLTTYLFAFLSALYAGPVCNTCKQQHQHAYELTKSWRTLGRTVELARRDEAPPRCIQQYKRERKRRFSVSFSNNERSVCRRMKSSGEARAERGSAEGIRCNHFNEQSPRVITVRLPATGSRIRMRADILTRLDSGVKEKTKRKGQKEIDKDVH